jgi:hypothetical protein
MSMATLKNIAFYFYQLLIVLGVFFYVVLKGAAGHGFIWYWYEVVCFLVGLSSILYGYLERLKKPNYSVRKVALILYLAVFLLAVVISISIISFKYGKDVNPIFFYVLTLLFTTCAGLNAYFVFDKKSIKQ